MSASRLRARLRALCLTLPLALGGCEWFTTFEQQPKVEPWEREFQSDSIAWLMGDTISFRANPQMSVPIYGTVAPGFIYSYAAMPGAVEAMSPIPNPVPADARSLENGRKYYAINCIVCHGEGGAGDGPAVKYGMIPYPINGAPARARTDGYIWGMIRNGRGLMPSYNRIEERDRWDVVNYVRALQGVVTAPIERGAVAAPGVTGAALPGATVMAPTRPAPYYHAPRARTGAPHDSTAQPATGAPAHDTTAQRGSPQ